MMAFLRPARTVYSWTQPLAQSPAQDSSCQLTCGILPRWTSAHLASLLATHSLSQLDTQFFLQEINFFPISGSSQKLFFLPGTSFPLSLLFGIPLKQNSQREALACHLQWHGGFPCYSHGTWHPPWYPHTSLDDYGFNVHRYCYAVSG